MLIDSITIVHPRLGDLVVAARLTGDAGFLLDKVKADPPARRLHTQDVAHMVGGIVVPGRAETRTVAVTGFIVAADRRAVNELRARLAAHCADAGTDPLVLRWEVLRDDTPVEVELFAHAAETPATFETEDGMTLAFTVEFVAPDPVAYVSGEASMLEVAAGASGVAWTDSDVPVWPTFTVYGPASGTTTAVTLTNTTTGLALALTGLTFTAGETITITTRPGYEEILEGGVNRMAQRTPGSRFWPLTAGESTVAFAATGGSGVRVEVVWRDGRVSW